MVFKRRWSESLEFAKPHSVREESLPNCVMNREKERLEEVTEFKYFSRYPG